MQERVKLFLLPQIAPEQSGFIPGRETRDHQCATGGEVQQSSASLTTRKLLKPLSVITVENLTGNGCARTFNTSDEQLIRIEYSLCENNNKLSNSYISLIVLIV